MENKIKIKSLYKNEGINMNLAFQTPKCVENLYAAIEMARNYAELREKDHVIKEKNTGMGDWKYLGIELRSKTEEEKEFIKQLNFELRNDEEIWIERGKKLMEEMGLKFDHKFYSNNDFIQLQDFFDKKIPNRYR